MTHQLDTSAVVAVARMLAEEFRSRLMSDPCLAYRYFEGDDSVERESLFFVCAARGISPCEYQLALGADASLLQLHLGTVTEAICGTADPGPHDRISRDSAGGNARNEHLVGDPHRFTGEEKAS